MVFVRTKVKGIYTQPIFNFLGDRFMTQSLHKSYRDIFVERVGADFRYYSHHQNLWNLFENRPFFDKTKTPKRNIFAKTYSKETLLCGAKIGKLLIGFEKTLDIQSPSRMKNFVVIFKLKVYRCGIRVIFQQMAPNSRGNTVVPNRTASNC